MNSGENKARIGRQDLGRTSHLMRVRTLFAVTALAAMLAGCSSIGPTQVFTNNYGPVTDAGYALPRIPIEKVPQKYRRQIVRYDTAEKPGTIVVDTANKFLYFVMADGKAMRYGIGVGPRASNGAAPPASR